MDQVTGDLPSGAKRAVLLGSVSPTLSYRASYPVQIEGETAVHLVQERDIFTSTYKTPLDGYVVFNEPTWGRNEGWVSFFELGWEHGELT